MINAVTSPNAISVRSVTIKKPSIKSAKIQDPVLVEQAIAAAWPLSQTLYWPTAHFRIAYTTSGGDATTLAYAQSVGNLIEQAYTAYSAFGFTMPAAPNDGKIDVILNDNPCIADIGMNCGKGGIAIPPAVSSLYGGDGDPLIIIRIGTNNSYLHVLTAHELFHQIQYQMAGFTTVFPHFWVLEGQAEAMEDIIWPANNDYIGDVVDYYALISQSLTLRSYDAVLFWKYLMMNHSGNNPSIVKDFLTAAASDGVYDGLKNTLVARGSTLDFAIHHFALWNLLVANRYVAGYYDDANNPSWPPMDNFMDDHVLGAIKSVPTNLEHLAGLSMRYFRVKPDSTVTSQRKLTVKAHGDADGHVRGWVVNIRTNGTTDIRDMGLAGAPSSSVISINDFSYADTREVVIILTNGFEGFELVGDYSVSLPTSIDLAFCMDTTGSMSGSISALKSTATSAMSTLGSSGADFRIAITEFKDFPISPYGDPGDFPYRPDSPFSSTPSVILGGINMLAASGGNDWPESTLSGIMGAINAQGIGGWRSGSNKSIVVMTDASPHDPEPYTGFTRASVVAAALAGGINVPPFARRVASSSQDLAAAAVAETPIKIYGVVIGGDYEAFASLTELANATGGKVWVTSYNPGDIAGAILEAIGEISEGGGDDDDDPPPSNHPPNVGGAIADPAQLWPANNKMVDVHIANVSDPDGDAVTISIIGITQDEPVNGENNGNRERDAAGVGTSTAQIRAERDGNGNGRTYAIKFTVTDGHGGSASGSVTVCVPHDHGGNTVCIDDGQSFDSTEP